MRPVESVSRPYPGTVVEFNAWFPDDAACLDYLAWLRWGDDGFGCHLCDAVGHGWLRGDGKSWDCGSCGSRTSATAGTIFHRTRTPLTVWFRAAWELTTRANGVSARGAQRTLGLGSYQTAWTMLHRYRRAMLMPDRTRLSGVVEVDDMFVGGRNKPGMAGRSTRPHKTPVLVMAEVRSRGIGRCRAVVVPRFDTASLRSALRDNIELGSLVRTDGLVVMAQSLDGFVHERKSVQGCGTPAHLLFPAVSRVQAQIKRWLDGTLQGAAEPEHLQDYLTEFQFRFNRRRARKPGLLFYRLLTQAVLTPPAGYADIVAGCRRDRNKPPQPPAGPRALPQTLAQPDAGRPWRLLARLNHRRHMERSFS
jgi:ISXO2-like transposase domain